MSLIGHLVVLGQFRDKCRSYSVLNSLFHNKATETLYNVYLPIKCHVCTFKHNRRLTLGNDLSQGQIQLTPAVRANMVMAVQYLHDRS